jgi:hypothetical protein
MWYRLDKFVTHNSYVGVPIDSICVLQKFSYTKTIDQSITVHILLTCNTHLSSINVNNLTLGVTSSKFSPIKNIRQGRSRTSIDKNSDVRSGVDNKDSRKNKDILQGSRLRTKAMGTVYL